MHSNINNNINSNSNNCPPWYNSADTIQQQQQQQQQHQEPQQHVQQLQLQNQQRISNWIVESNKNQQQVRININNNINNNSNSMCNNNQNMLQRQQQQQQQHYLQQQQQQQQYNYQQQQNIATTAATTLPAMNCYYAQRLQQQYLTPQQQQQQLLLLQQQQQHQHHQQHQHQHQHQQQPQLVSVDGIQSGVPTLTTSTLTPTTLRSIEETFIQLTSEPINAPYQAGFIPPPLASFSSVTNTGALGTPTTNYSSIPDYNDGLVDTESEDSQGSWNAQNIEENSVATTDSSSGATDSTSFQNGLNGMGNNSLATSTSSTNDFTTVNIALAAAAAAAAAGKINSISNKNTSNSATPRRNQGGRRPNKSANMTPEEEEKRRIRRERNKLAAARCRKRRVDQTNELLEEVAILEKKREGLQKDIESLNTTRQELEYLLEAHRPTCQKVREDLLSVSTYGGLIAPTSTSATITGLDPSLSTTGRSHSPLDLKPVLLPGNMLEVVQVKNEPLDTALDSGSSLDGHDHDGSPPPKRILLTRNNPMIPPPLPNVATLSASLAAASASLNTPIVTTAPVSFSSFGSFNNNCATLQTLNALNKPSNGKQRPNSLPTVPRNLTQNLGLNVDNKPPTDINGVAIQTPSTGMFNFDSLMDGGTGLTPVSGPLIPTCSSQNKHPLELTTPTSEPSKLVSL